ncbi:hypothetical protein Dimus_002229 [Dionaea muscipula]
MACYSWTLRGLLGAFLDLAITYFLLCCSTVAFFLSRFLGFFGLSIPLCSCTNGFIGCCLQLQRRLLVHSSATESPGVEFSIRTKFPFESAGGNEVGQLNLGSLGDRGLVGLGGEASSGSPLLEVKRSPLGAGIGPKNIVVPVGAKDGRFDVKGKGVVVPQRRRRIARAPTPMSPRRRRGRGRGRGENLLCRKSLWLLSVYEEDSQVETVESLRFGFYTVHVATNGFSETNKLGEGGFGSVYKGILVNGEVVAVKRLGSGSSQGELEFKNEVLSMTRVQHKNLVKLVGFCFEGRERILVYEFVPNASLDKFLFDPIRRLQLNWEVRYNIIRGIARGMLYLHEESRLKIIHRDLKAANVLLDENLNPKIADFGMARHFAGDYSTQNTKRIVGT